MKSFIKNNYRRLFLFYYNLRYLNVLFLRKKKEIYRFSYENFVKSRAFIFMQDSKFEELFEMADKAEYLAASMLEIDLSEVNPSDNFKENYIFTVFFFLK